MASGPCSALTRPSPSATRVSASSHEARRKPPLSRTSGEVRRSRERENWWAKRPLTQVWPLLAGPSIAGLIEMMRPPTRWASSLQPTPQ